MKKKVCAVLLGTALTCHVPLVYGAVQDYQAVTEADKEDNKIFQAFSTEDGSGNSVNVAAIQDTVYVAAKNAGIYSKPGESSASDPSVSASPSSVCTSIFSRLCTVRPYFRQWTPPAFSATLPPMEQAICEEGSGA